MVMFRTDPRDGQSQKIHTPYFIRWGGGFFVLLFRTGFCIWYLIFNASFLVDFNTDGELPEDGWNVTCYGPRGFCLSHHMMVAPLYSPHAMSSVAS